jgi:hypothetical protein
MRVKTMLMRILWVCLGIIASQIALEMVLRMGLFHCYSCTALQMRGDTRTAERRLFLMGDSFVAYPYFHQLFLKDLPQTEILNTALNGAGPIDYLQEFLNHGPKFHPHVAILFYYAGTDVTQLQYLSDPHSGVDFKNRLRALIPSSIKNLYVYRFYKDLQDWLTPFFLSEARLKSHHIPDELIRNVKARKINPWLVRSRLDHPDVLTDNLVMATSENEKAFQKVLDILRTLHLGCGQMGTELLIVALPHTLQVNASHQSFYEEAGFHVDMEAFHRDIPQGRLRKFCADERIAFLDLLPVFRANPNELFIHFDEHLNKKGCDVAESAIVQCLKTNTRFFDKHPARA